MFYFVLLLLIILGVWFFVEKRRRKSYPMSGGLHEDISLPYEQEFELYGNSFSHCSRKTRIAMAELGIAYKHRPIDLIETGKYETISPHYLRVNPAGILPTLVHNGHPIYESDDILAYAAQQASGNAAPLVPADETARAEMQAWIDRASISSSDAMGAMERDAGACIPGLTMPIFMTSIRYIPLHKIAVGLLFHPDKVRPIFFTASKVRGLRAMLRMGSMQKIIHRSRDLMIRHLTEFQDHLTNKGGPWVMGNQYTLADVTWSCIFLRLDETGWLDHFFEQGNFDRLSSYYNQVKARPSWQAAILDKSHPIIDKASADLKRAISEDANIAHILRG